MIRGFRFTCGVALYGNRRTSEVAVVRSLDGLRFWHENLLVAPSEVEALVVFVEILVGVLLLGYDPATVLVDFGVVPFKNPRRFLSGELAAFLVAEGMLAATSFLSFIPSLRSFDVEGTGAMMVSLNRVEGAAKQQSSANLFEIGSVRNLRGSLKDFGSCSKLPVVF